jgi:hypothetical protein
MSVTKTITLTSSRPKSGPYYEVSCSNDCITYGPCITPGPLYLPTIGSSVNVDIYDTTQCIKLVNFNADCNNEVIKTFTPSGSTTTTSTTTTTIPPEAYKYYNAYEYVCNPCTYTGNEVVVKIFYDFAPSNPTAFFIFSDTTGKVYKPFLEVGITPGAILIPDYSKRNVSCGPVCTYATTTTTTTIAPTTTTTTTTAAPTTTTTTFSPDPCICTEVVITSAGGEVETFNCYGVNQNYVYMSAGTYYLCAAKIGGLLQAFFAVGTTGTITEVGNCKTQTCPPATTTTTTIPPTTTTTTTIAPTTTTTTAGAFVEIYITNSSLDVPINDMTINGVAVTFAGGGDNFPVNAGENGNFTSTQLGTKDVIIYYGSSIPGQNIVFTDSDSNITCHNVGAGSGLFVITDAIITGGTTITVTVTDGACS